MLMLESAAAGGVRIPSRNFYRLFSRSAGHRSRVRGLTETSCGKKFWRDNKRIRASSKEQFSSSGSEPVKRSVKPMGYHQLEDIAVSELKEEGEARLTPAETTRTLIEVNNSATLVFTGVASNETHENIFCQDLPYLTDEHGSIYFQVMDEENLLQNLTSYENHVQVFIGLDSVDVLSEMQSFIQSEIDFGIDEFDDEDAIINGDYSDDNEGDIDDDDHGDVNDYEEEWDTVLDHEDDGDDGSEGSLVDWSKLETMRSSHPMYFARRLTEVVNDGPIDFMEQSPVGLSIQGILRTAYIEEHTILQKQISDNEFSDMDWSQNAKSSACKERSIAGINGHGHKSGSDQDDSKCAEELEKDEGPGNGTSFYKLEMVKIQFISAHGHQTDVEIEDFRRAQPDAIAHSAVKILSRFKAGGEKTIQALKSLCMRQKGIQVEEVALIGVDSLGIDLRVCSGTQVQTLRFPFKKRASSEYSAERQLNNILFPRLPKLQQRKKAQQAES
ncbi:unnamed protein product [Cuscuta campestris]|uniref:Uncharacterized protein n=1 Tax=Cuscuta campestris TaxID=132261 RepID=A0A484KSU8_9ASTE|nr:unnamed protein product [Cuscuta campestris]